LRASLRQLGFALKSKPFTYDPTARIGVFLAGLLDYRELVKLRYRRVDRLVQVSSDKGASSRWHPSIAAWPLAFDQFCGIKHIQVGGERWSPTLVAQASLASSSVTFAMVAYCRVAMRLKESHSLCCGLQPCVFGLTQNGDLLGTAAVNN
jgi:hypothetical protein